MAESIDLFVEIAMIRNQVDDLSSITAALLRVNSAELVQGIVDFLTNDEVSRRIFIMCDGRTTQAEIVAALKGVPGGSAPMVTGKIQGLVSDYHLIALDHNAGRSRVYRKTEVARVLHIERALKRAGLIPK